MNEKERNTEQLIDLLRKEGYGPCEARVTAHDLSNFEAEYQSDLRTACNLWIKRPDVHPTVSEDPYSTDSLMDEYGMTYPAALVAIDWLRSDPQQAKACLASRG